MADESRKTVRGLVEDGLSYLCQIKATDRALILLQDEVSGNLVVRAAHNLASDDLGGSGAMSTRVLTESRQRARAVLVLDARQDDRFRHCNQASRREFLSALCVPILDGGHRTVGLLYADNASRPGAFTYAHLSQTERFGRELGRELARARKSDLSAPPQDAVPVPRQGPDLSGPLLIPLGLIALAILLAVVGAAFSAQRPPPPRPTPGSTPAAVAATQAEPLAVARTFIVQVQMRRFREAWKLLSPGLQERLPYETFVEQAQAWLSDPVNRWELGYRKAVEGTRGDTLLVVRVEPAQKTGRHTQWKWTLRKTESGWRISELEGAPLRPVKGSSH